eukprot:scaffold441103_cov38-Prasinocladus_malaysianus.AAC.1
MCLLAGLRAFAANKIRVDGLRQLNAYNRSNACHRSHGSIDVNLTSKQASFLFLQTSPASAKAALISQYCCIACIPHSVFVLLKSIIVVDVLDRVVSSAYQPACLVCPPVIGTLSCVLLCISVFVNALYDTVG